MKESNKGAVYINVFISRQTLPVVIKIRGG